VREARADDDVCPAIHEWLDEGRQKPRRVLAVAVKTHDSIEASLPCVAQADAYGGARTESLRQADPANAQRRQQRARLVVGAVIDDENVLGRRIAADLGHETWKSCGLVERGNQDQDAHSC
jgi:hypothetical protein